MTLERDCSQANQPDWNSSWLTQLRFLSWGVGLHGITIAVARKHANKWLIVANDLAILGQVNAAVSSRTAITSLAHVSSIIYECSSSGELLDISQNIRIYAGFLYKTEHRADVPPA
jgi:hypothetical protein